MQTIKRCTKCGINKSIDLFYRTNDSWCKCCHNNYIKQKRAGKNTGKKLEKQLSIVYKISAFLLNGKTCIRCGILKTKNEYSKHSRNIDGHENICKECKKKSDSLFHKNNYKKNKEYIKTKTKEYAQQNREKVNKNMRERKAIARAEISKLYVKHLLKIKAKDITNEMIKLKTEQIELKRLSRQIRNTLKETKNETSSNTN